MSDPEFGTDTLEPDDRLEGEELDFAADPTSDEEAELLPLFPQGADTPNLDELAQAWACLFVEPT